MTMKVKSGSRIANREQDDFAAVARSHHLQPSILTIRDPRSAIHFLS
jgi:hypothetical protein